MSSPGDRVTRWRWLLPTNRLGPADYDILGRRPWDGRSSATLHSARPTPASPGPLGKGTGGPQGRRGKAPVEAPADFRSWSSRSSLGPSPSAPYDAHPALRNLLWVQVTLTCHRGDEPLADPVGQSKGQSRVADCPDRTSQEHNMIAMKSARLATVVFAAAF